VHGLDPLSFEVARPTEKDDEMAHYEVEATAIERVWEVLTEQGLEGMAGAMQTLMNEAIRLERVAFLGAPPGERSSERIGRAGRRVRIRRARCCSRVGGRSRRPECGVANHWRAVGGEEGVTSQALQLEWGFWS